MKKSDEGLLKKLPPPPDGKSGWPWDKEVNPSVYAGENYSKISIVTPSYNQGEFIEQTIRSVLLQNYPNTEYIIIDGGSSDRTLSVIKKYERWVKYWTSEKDKGQSNAINKGIARSEGEIFTWINSDDYFAEECFAEVAREFAQGNTDMVVGSYRFFDEKNSSKDKTIDFRLSNTLEETLALVLLNQPSAFYSLPKLKELGMLDERLNYLMDQDMWKKFLFRNGQERIRVISAELTHFRYHGKSKTFKYEFSIEYGRIFRSIALKAGLENHAALVEVLFNCKDSSEYEFDYQFSDEDVVLARRVINNLIYYYARKFYTTKKMELLKLCFQVIEPHHLNEKQSAYLRKIKIKSRLINLKLSPVIELLSGSPVK